MGMLKGEKKKTLFCVLLFLFLLILKHVYGITKIHFWYTMWYFKQYLCPTYQIIVHFIILIFLCMNLTEILVTQCELFEV